VVTVLFHSHQIIHPFTSRNRFLRCDTLPSFQMKNAIMLIASVVIALHSTAQGVKISQAPGNADASSIVEMESNSQGFLPPRMTAAERDQIVNPALGLMIFNTTTLCTNVYIGTNWQEICGSCTPEVSAPSAGMHSVTASEIQWNWNAVPGATGYKWNTSNDYLTATDLGNALTVAQTGLNAATAYTVYVWAYGVCGESQPGAALSATTSAPPCVVGNIGPGGGRIFYCGSAYPGFVGLEAAPYDQSSGAPWGCSGGLLSGANGTSVGTGYQNTLDITTECGDSGTAARICADLDLNGYSDWFLPSVDEINLMYSNLHTQNLGNFSNSIYWTSSQNNNFNAKNFNFSNGNVFGNGKGTNYYVRAARRF
jgi:hypothetical protein